MPIDLHRQRATILSLVEGQHVDVDRAREKGEKFIPEREEDRSRSSRCSGSPGKTSDRRSERSEVEEVECSCWSSARVEDTSHSNDEERRRRNTQRIEDECSTGRPRNNDGPSSRSAHDTSNEEYHRTVEHSSKHRDILRSFLSLSLSVCVSECSDLLIGEGNGSEEFVDQLFQCLKLFFVEKGMNSSENRFQAFEAFAEEAFSSLIFLRRSLLSSRFAEDDVVSIHSQALTLLVTTTGTKIATANGDRTTNGRTSDTHRRRRKIRSTKERFTSLTG